ncbi:hypothetical protein BH10ACT1_BH10ACT1_00780 [soil metagenome]
MDEAPLPLPEAVADPPAGAPRTYAGPPNKATRNAVIGTLIALVVAGYVSAGLLSFLLSEHPLVFIGLSSTNRNLALASGDLAAWSFYLVAFLRLLAPDPLFFLLGRWYGDGAIRWMERKSPSYGQLMRQLEKWFEKARYVMVVVAPNNPVCLFAGASTMTWSSFLVANVIGTIGRLVLIRAFSSVFEDLLGPVRSFISDYQKPLLVVSVVLVGVSIWSERRAGRSSIGDLANIEDEIAAGEGSGRSSGPGPADEA